MRTAVIFIIAVCASIVIAPPNSMAQQVPLTMTYQGYVTDLAGTPMADGNYNFTFLIYPSEFGGSTLWTETHPNVPVTKGLFNVILGRGSPSVPLNMPFDTQYFLGIRIGADPELSPRVRLATSAYSFRSREADAVRDGSITDNSVAAGANISDSKLESTVLTENEIVAGTGVTVNKVGGTLTIAAIATPVTLAGDVTGPAGSNVIADNAVTPAKIAPNIVSSINNVSNDAGNIDIIAGANITVAPNDAMNSITISAADGGLTLPYTGSVASSSPAMTVTNTGAGDGMKVTAGAGYGIDVYNNSSTVTAGRFVNTNTSSNASALYVRSYGTDATMSVKNYNSSGSAIILAGYQSSGNLRLTVDNSGDLWTHGRLDATSVTTRTTLGPTATPDVGGHYSDNVVYAWANVNSTGGLTAGFGCVASRTAVGTYSIGYRRTMVGSSYAPMAIALEGASPQFAVIAAASNIGCTVKIWKFASGSFSLVDSQFFFHLTGKP